MRGTALSELPDRDFSAPRQRDARRQRFSEQTQPDTAAGRYRVAPQTEPSTGQPQQKSSFLATFFGAAVMAALLIGWINRNDNSFTPVSGPGYWLGIAGGSMMLILALYPMRKRVRTLSAIGSPTFWFNAHVVLGIVGPVLILWHANFKLGSFNSAVALITTLVVAGSGLIGRYLHAKINYGLYERKAEAQGAGADADELRGFIGSDPRVTDLMVTELNAFAQLGTTVPNGLLTALVLLPRVSWRGARLRMRLVSHARRVIAMEGKRHSRPRKVQRQQLDGVTEFVNRYIDATRRAATFAFYERLFRLWHVFHVPLYILLLIVASFHVYAAHFF